MNNSRIKTLSDIRGSVELNQSNNGVGEYKADGLTIVEAYSIMLMQLRVYRAENNLRRFLNEMQEKEMTSPVFVPAQVR